MSNVLPSEAKKLLDRRARWRAVFVIGCVGTVTALMAALALVPTFISIATARATLDATMSEAEGNARELQVPARRAQALVDALEPVLLASASPVTMLSDALGLLPPGITVTAITYQAAQGTLVLTGEAARRESANAYRDALEASHRFRTVDVPVAALAGTQDGRFTVTLTAL